MSGTREHTRAIGEAPEDLGDETTVRRSTVVRTSLEHAFATFTEGMSTWWPAEHHIATVPMAAVIMEPRAGGRWYELCTNGSECDWGVVLEWDPPHHVAWTWHLDGDFRYHPQAGLASRIDVRFSAQADGTTLVELVHSGLDRHGATWRRLRDAVGSPSGWTGSLRLFSAALEDQHSVS